MHRSLFIVGLFLTLRVFAASVGGIVPQTTEVYVSASGDDSQNGHTPNRPWKTLTYTQTQVRTIAATQPRDIVIHIMGNLADSLALTSSDSGQGGHRIKWTSQVGAIDNGATITGWTLVSSGLYKASYAGTNPRACWTNEVRDYRSRRGSGLVSAMWTSTGYTTTDMASTRNPLNVELVYIPYPFTESRNVITAIGGGTITMRAPAHGYITSAFNVSAGSVAPSDIENCYEDFIANATPGTFYDDEANSFIYYFPRGGENMGTVSFVAAAGPDYVVTATGTSHVDFENLVIKHNNWDLRPNGFASIAQCYYFDAAFPIDDGTAGSATTPPAALYISGCTDVNVTGGNYQHLSTIGVTRTFTSINCLMTGTTIDDVAANGFEIGSPTESALTTVSSGCNTTGCTVTNVGMEFKGSCGGVIPFCNTTTVGHNFIQNSPYLGITWGLGLSFHPEWQTNKVDNNFCTNNRLDNTFLNLLDGGSVYAQNIQNGSGGTGLTITGNYSTHANQSHTSQTPPSAGLYLDQGTSGVTINNNVWRFCGSSQFFNQINEGPALNTVGTNYCDVLNDGHPGSPAYTATTVVADFSVGIPAAIIANAGP